VEFELFEGQDWDVETPELKKVARGLLGSRYTDGNVNLKVDSKDAIQKMWQE
jgi:hypothetical protein